MQAKITKRAVDALTAEDGKEVTLWDTEVKGFGVRARSGGAKSYILQYRAGAGRDGILRKLTIGKHGSPWTPDKAREEAKRLLGLVADGEDPAGDKGADRKALTVAQLCDLYLSEGCAAKKASTLYTDRGRIERHIKPLLGKKKAQAVTKADVQRFMQDVAAGKTAVDEKTGAYGRAIVEGGKGTATRTVGLLGGIFTFAVERGLCAVNPVQGVKRYKDNKGERFLSSAEMARLGEALAAAEAEGRTPPQAIAAIRLLILTGCRKSEILSLQWSHVDFERGYLRLPDSKTGAKAVALGAPALELLAALPRLHGNDHVLPATTGAGHFVGLPRPWARIKEAAGLSEVRVHDLRHSFASFGAAGGDSLIVIGALLGHRDSKTTSRYTHLGNDPVKAAADRISATIAAAMTGGADTAEVIALPQRKTRT